ncbi:MAG: LptA/OstA family protein [Opitutales bacterium]
MDYSGKACVRGKGRPVWLLFLLSAAGVFGQMTPSAPVENFRFPRFGEDGYTDWVLEGGKGAYESEEQVVIEEMELRVYSGDARRARELTLQSPEATLRVKENRGHSEAPIRINGGNFGIHGEGWSWDGNQKKIQVHRAVEVEFREAIADAFRPGASAGAGGKNRKTEIESEELVLETTEENHRFLFRGAVKAVSREMELESGLMIALVEAPGDENVPRVEGSGLDAVRRVIAREDVTIREAGRTMTADEADFAPREQTVHLSGTPEIMLPSAFVAGAEIRSREGELVVTGSESAGRARMILSKAGGLGIQGEEERGSDTIILADNITVKEFETENRFFFEGSVDVQSGELQLAADAMRVDTVNARAATGSGSSEKEALEVGELKRMVAEGGVKLKRADGTATGEKIVFYPDEERAELTGDPRVANETAVVTGGTMEFEADVAEVYGGPGERRVKVTLPVLPDMGYAAAGDSSPAQDAAGEGGRDTEARDTVVRSRRLRMTGLKDGARFFEFSEDVTIDATNLNAGAERMEVTAEEVAPSANRGESGKNLRVQLVEGIGNVRIEQEGRVATAGKARLYPGDGKMVLIDKVVVQDERGKVSGHRAVLNQGERRVRMEGGGEDGERPSMTLPAMPEE